ncbi:ATP-binding response regulator [Serratia marcescens]|uniref:ATP-binding response regulator n=1 Tax=Serratia marcescens TaxID=615 RepID=UPI003FA766D3
MKLKKIIIQYLVTFIMLTGAFYWMYDRYFSTEHNVSSAGPQENYAWAIAKFAIKLAAFEAKTERQLRLKSTDIKVLQRDLDILFSGSNVLLNKSDSTRYLYQEDEYGETINAIHGALGKIDSELQQAAPNFDLILKYISFIRDKNLALISIADHAEVRQRTIIYDDYLKKGNSFKIPIIAIYVILILMLLISFKQLTSMNNQLESEKKAFNNKNAFLGKLGHELRTTLQAIVSSIEVIIFSPDEKANKNVLRRLESAVSQIEQQMNDLAEYAKIDNGSIKINKSVVNIGEIISRTVSECNAKFSKKHLVATIKSQPHYLVISDQVRLTQIIENLLTNAFKYTDKGEISVEASLTEDRAHSTLTIEINDTGIGIDKEKQKLIYHPFVRIDNGYSSVPGSGMGLAIVDGIIKAMNGSIHLNSEPGKGSCFTVKIPVDIAKEHDMLNLENTNETEGVKKGLTILYVDDNELTCNSMVSTLNSVGYKAEAVCSVNRAIEKLMRIPYDIVLSDLQMPVMSGDQLLSVIRDHEGPNQNTPFIFVSAYPENYTHADVPLIVKPGRITNITMEINKLIS